MEDHIGKIFFADDGRVAHVAKVVGPTIEIKQQIPVSPPHRPGVKVLSDVRNGIRIEGERKATVRVRVRVRVRLRVRL